MGLGDARTRGVGDPTSIGCSRWILSWSDPQTGRGMFDRETSLDQLEDNRGSACRLEKSGGSPAFGAGGITFFETNALSRVFCA
jgi:hypothetical protein